MSEPTQQWIDDTLHGAREGYALNGKQRQWLAAEVDRLTSERDAARREAEDQAAFAEQLEAGCCACHGVAKAENARYRAALEKLARNEHSFHEPAGLIARDALDGRAVQ